MLLTLFDVIAPVLGCALVGWAWGRFGGRFDVETVSTLVLNVSAPCLIFHSLVSLDVAPEALSEMAALAALAIAIFAVIGWISLKLLGLPSSTFLGPLAFNNCGNLGLGICLFAFGQEGLALGVAYFAVSFVAHSLVGDLLFAGKASLRPLLASPLSWSVAAAALFLGFDIPLPVSLERTTEVLGAPTIPMMLITLGVSLSQLSLGGLGVPTLISVMRLAMGAGVGFALAELAELEGAMRGILVLECAMPVGVLNYLFAQKYDRDPVGVAGAVMISTLLSFVTIPLLLAYLMPS